MTSQELHDRIASGMKVALVPIGGTEQSGPHLALGKHNFRARDLAVRIAGELGNAIVAPVLSYVPEGSISPPTGHMRFAGTISIPEAAFESVLEGAARSLCQHGFRAVYFLGDHGGYQAGMKRVTEKLSGSGTKSQCQVRAVPQYYEATQTVYVDALRQRGLSAQEIGRHAGLADTSLSMAIDPASVRAQKLAEAAHLGSAGGVDGDPTRASADLGRIGVRAIIDATVKAIRASSPPR